MAIKIIFLILHVQSRGRHILKKNWIESVDPPKKLNRIGELSEKIGSDQFFVKSRLSTRLSRKKLFFVEINVKYT
jgi:hypothetical protein